MNIRTDLALDLFESKKDSEKTFDIYKDIKKRKTVNICKIKIENKEQEAKIGKKMGEYITLEFNSVEKIADFSEIEEEIINALKSLLPQKRENILIVGLGNSDITCDSIGPLVADKILATRHIAGQFAEQIGLKGLKSVSVIAPNVLGKTGIEVSEIIEGIVRKTEPDAVIVIDACVSSSINRIFKTVQFCNSGISPGSGVKNSRKELSTETLKVPVIAVGVPTVVDAVNLAKELTNTQPIIFSDMIVTPKESDLLSHRISEIIATALNIFLQPEIEKQVLLSLV